MPSKEEAIHLGDGAYAIFDGYGVWLRANDHREAECTGQVYLEPEVFQALINFMSTFGLQISWPRE